MFVNLNWIIGVTAVGKTTYVEAVEKCGNVKAIYTGKMAREAIGAEKMAESSNPTAPAEIENTIRAMVYREMAGHIINSYHDGDKVLDIWIDSMPRSVVQADWCMMSLLLNIKKELVGMKIGIRFHQQVVLASCKEEEHHRRVLVRHALAGGTDVLMGKRLTADKIALYGILEHMVGNNVIVRKLDLTHKV
jgi:dephospho-CoA kinase